MRDIQKILLYPLFPVAIFTFFIFIMDIYSKQDFPPWFYITIATIIYFGFVGMVAFEIKRAKTVEQMTEEEKTKESKTFLKALKISVIVTMVVALWMSNGKFEFSLNSFFGTFRLWIIILAVVWGLLEGRNQLEKRKQ